MINDFIEIWVHGEDILWKIILVILVSMFLTTWIAFLKGMVVGSLKERVLLSIGSTVLFIGVSVGVLMHGTAISAENYVKDNIEDFTEVNQEMVKNVEIKEMPEGNCELEYDRGENFRKVSEIDCSIVEVYEGEDPVIYEREETREELFGESIEEMLEEENLRIEKIMVPNNK